MLYTGWEPSYMGITTHQLLPMFLNGHTQTDITEVTYDVFRALINYVVQNPTPVDMSQ
jgi:hypothetical protein